ncbi:ADP-ribosylglycohydrolase family protein [Reyranella sp.]|uniref:ADP-ribosylglycohydrolase family protein n=1 Tax=Reyranella sp. TaxID=1929291 RepID=UPI003BA9997F
MNSALWAAGGDALGWMTELSRGQGGVEYRTGLGKVERPVRWRRIIGGRNGPRVELPSGTYSDDTQLRLAVCRAIRGDGSFDVEAFAKVEITVWPTYALGGGLGTKAAAVNLSKRGVNWFSNFFESGDQKYVRGGGNGAAMRIQPHVWASSGSLEELILDVLRDALVTHGHPHGFCGALFHALALAETISKGTLPTIEDWSSFARQIGSVSEILASDSQLATFWQSAWENASGLTLHDALMETRDELLRDIDTVAPLLRSGSYESYRSALEALGCVTPAYRGSGLKTALAASVLADVFRDGEIGQALAVAANELDSDTDTIATMAGALMGATANEPPKWDIQDYEYIVREAQRLAAIAQGIPQDSFSYPDLARWNPPTKQIASVGLLSNGIAIAGLGELRPEGREYRSGDAIWQWCELPFGQTILAKRSVILNDRVPIDQLPGQRQSAQAISERDRMNERSTPQQRSLLPNDGGSGKRTDRPSVRRQYFSDLDQWTTEAISSGFDERIVGRLLNECIDATDSIEAAIAFAAIIAKAKIARRRRR